MVSWGILYIGIASIFLLSNLSVSDASFHCDPEHGRFQCPDGICITAAQVCDFRHDCRDSSDEKNCTLKECDETIQFRCQNGKCIHKEWTCDKANDCFDNSDENETLCASTGYCTDANYLCKRSNTCILKEFKCDGEFDCDGGEDEDDCPPPTCTKEEKLCKNAKECQDKEYFCDGDPDCDDGSDEENCMICEDTQFKCADGSKCINAADRCDTLRDCIDGSDEEDCPSDHVNRCNEGYFPCKSTGICLPDIYQCNGRSDCSDKSDEIGCDSIKSDCPAGEKLCGNQRQCVNVTSWCDGARDCFDKSDESECPNNVPDPSCSHKTHFRCKSGTCIRESQLCNIIKDCKDGSDEPLLCNQNECEFANGNCSHVCTDLKIGFKCSCPPGWRLKDDGFACEDIDECETIDDTCEYKCVNVEGSYRCLNSSRSPAVNIIVADRNKIDKLTLQHHQLSIPVLTNVTVISIAVDVKNQLIFWSDPRSETISRTKLSNPSQHEILLSGDVVENPMSLAYDWVHQLLFWVDTSPSSVSVMSTRKPYSPKTLIKSSQAAISSIAVHPPNGFLFVGYELSRASVSGRLDRCGMDGRNCSTLFHKMISVPIDITVDHERNLLFWIDEQLRILVVSYLDGSQRRNIDIATHRPRSLAVFSNRVYFVDDVSRGIISIDRKGGNVKVFKEHLSLNTDLAIYEKTSQKAGENQCADRCDGLCLPTASQVAFKGHSCVCPDGFFISKTNSCFANPTKKPTTVPTTTVTSPATQQTATSSSAILIVGVISSVVILVCVTWLLVRFKRQRSARMSMNFNNPIYKKMNGRLSSESTPTDESPTTSSGSLSKNSTAALMLNEEGPDMRDPPTFAGVVDSGRYEKLPNHDNDRNDFIREHRRWLSRVFFLHQQCF